MPVSRWGTGGVEVWANSREVANIRPRCVLSSLLVLRSWWQHSPTTAKDNTTPCCQTLGRSAAKNSSPYIQPLVAVVNHVRKISKIVKGWILIHIRYLSGLHPYFFFIHSNYPRSVFNINVYHCTHCICHRCFFVRAFAMKSLWFFHSPRPLYVMWIFRQVPCDVFFFFCGFFFPICVTLAIFMELISKTVWKTCQRSAVSYNIN